MDTIEKDNAKVGDTDAVNGVEHWFVMRDLTRPNAKLPARLMLEKMGIDYFTPMVWKLFTNHGRHEKKEVPYMHDLVFVHGSRAVIDPIVERVGTFQYRFLKHREPMSVRDDDMERFIRAVKSSENPHYYTLNEITPNMLHHRIRIIGGTLDGYEGSLLTVRGSKTKRLLVELPSLLAAAVEVTPEYIRLL